MTPDHQRIAIAEALGWTIGATTNWHPYGGAYSTLKNPLEGVPNYTEDLNSMHDAEKTLNTDQQMRFRFKLFENSGKRDAKYITTEAAICHATAAERAEAFLKTIGKWEP